MAVYTVHEAKTRLSQLLAESEAGHEVVIARGSKPAARLVPLSGPASPRRPLGRLAGRGAVADPGWAAEEIRALFEAS
jgi:prevent-host-death family protein